MKVSDEVQLAFDKAKIQLMNKDNAIFITTILLHLKHVMVPGDDVNTPTAKVDGRTMWVNVDFFMGLTEGQRVTLLAHEAWHPALMHMVRVSGREFKRYNAAGDYVINDLLVLGRFEPIPGWLHDISYRGMDTNAIYDLLPSDPDGGSMGGDMLPPGPGENPNDDPTEALSQDLTDILTQATAASKMGGDAPGTIPGDIQIELDKLLSPKLPWHNIYRKFMRNYAKNDYSFRRPNRRFQPDHYLPGMFSESVGHLAFACDSSASVTDKEFLQIITEIHDVRKRLKPDLMTVMNFDTRIGTVHKMTKSQKIADIEFTGRGGTDIFPVFDYFKDNKPLVLTVFSDLDCRPLDYDPGYPVIWVCVNNPGKTVNYGKLIHLETQRF